MKSLLILIIFIISTSVDAKEKADLKNLVIHKTPKTYENIVFFDSKGQKIELSNLKGKLVILNFWATWCAPCREEMPSLNLLQASKELNNIKIFPINIAEEKIEKSKVFFEELNIENLDVYSAPQIKIVKKLSLRGVPTSIIFSKEGKELARVIGSTDFNSKNFIDWLKEFD